MFYYLMKLHYSQTLIFLELKRKLFYYLMKLHYSQTVINDVTNKKGFTTLWNYTILKQLNFHLISNWRFTTLWNYTILKHFQLVTALSQVLLPYEITLFSNHPYYLDRQNEFYYLMKLHYSQTLKNIQKCI